MKSYWRDLSTVLHRGTAVMMTAALMTAPVAPAFAQGDDARGDHTRTPIKHIILIIGENRTFDHVFATYEPKSGETVDNLLSKGIVTAAGKPGPNYSLAKQYSATVEKTYSISPTTKKAYTVLPPAMTDGAPSSASNTNPPPFATVAAVTATEAVIKDGLPTADFNLLTTGATGLTSDSVDTRVPDATKLPSGPYQLSSATLPYELVHGQPGASLLPDVAGDRLLGHACHEDQSVGLPERPVPVR